MPTREQYMKGHVTHEEYYSYIVKLAGIKFDYNSPLVLRAVNSKDEHYNDIPLKTWDGYALLNHDIIEKALKQAEDFYSLASGVCVMKQAVRIAIEEHDNMIRSR